MWRRSGRWPGPISRCPSASAKGPRRSARAAARRAAALRGARGLAHDEPLFHQAIDQLHRAVVLDEQLLREVVDRDAPVTIAALAALRGKFRLDLLRSLDRVRGLDERVAQTLDLVNLTARRDTPVSELAYGEKRRLEIGLALASGPSRMRSTTTGATAACCSPMPGAGPRSPRCACCSCPSRCISCWGYATRPPAAGAARCSCSASARPARAPALQAG